MSFSACVYICILIMFCVNSKREHFHLSRNACPSYVISEQHSEYCVEAFC